MGCKHSGPFSVSQSGCGCDVAAANVFAVNEAPCMGVCFAQAYSPHSTGNLTTHSAHSVRALCIVAEYAIIVVLRADLLATITSPRHTQRKNARDPLTTALALFHAQVHVEYTVAKRRQCCVISSYTVQVSCARLQADASKVSSRQVVDAHRGRECLELFERRSERQPARREGFPR
jgi:hypothetical protein